MIVIVILDANLTKPLYQSQKRGWKSNVENKYQFCIILGIKI
jgi:hypothetical protein